MKRLYDEDEKVRGNAIVEVRIVLADDHIVIREGLKMIIESHQMYRVVGETEDRDKLERLVAQSKPQLVISDLRLPCGSIMDTSRTLKERYPHLKWMIFTGNEDSSNLYRALEVGIEAYVKKQTHPKQILNAIQMVLAGYTCYHSRLELGQRDEDTLRLTEREREIFQLIIDNLTNIEISQRLCISEATVKTHVSSILRKTGQPNRSQAVLYALREGLFPMIHTRIS